ncbi:MAG: beta strand repeat-containing protein [Candidatus Saccharimonadota bacterium]|jgi:hypothetical protein
MTRSLGKFWIIGFLCASLILSISAGLVLSLNNTANAAPGINEQINFQGRLYSNTGGGIADGNYNMQFRIYRDGDGLTAGNTTGSPAGTLLWTESWLNANSQGVSVVNGFLSVQLGSITPFGSSVDWAQDTLWLSVNVGSTNGSCTPFTSCTPDGEMVPMKRLSATPYALNSKLFNGLAASNFVQLAQGVQADASTNTSSIFINKTGTGGNYLQFQNAAVDVFTLSNTGSITLGNNADKSISVATSNASTAGRNLTLASGQGGSGTGSAGGTLTLQGGAAGGTNGNGGNVVINGGARTGGGTDGTISIGTSNTSSIQIGATSTSVTQNVGIGNNNTAGSNTNVTIGAGGSATSGSTTIQSKDSTTISTNGVVRGTFDTAGNLYLGNGVTAATPNNFTIRGTGSSTTAVAGGALTIQGGNATVGNANGGNITLTGGAGVGTGVNGLVVISTPTFSTTTNDPNCYTGGAIVAATCTIAVASVNNSSAVIVGFSTTGQTANLPDPTTLTAGRVVYVTAANGSSEFTLSVNGGGTGNQIAMRQNTTATMIWNGSDWTAAGASSSTTLQSAYDSTLQSAGGAELIVSKTSNTNGLTIRDSATNAVNGTLLSVQTSSAAGLLSVNSAVTEYVTNAGAETAGGTSTTFPANTWSAINGSTVSRHTTAGNYIATGQGSVSIATSTTAGSGVRNRLSTSLTPNMAYNVSFTTRLTAGTFTDLDVIYSNNGTANSVTCATAKASVTSVWTKVNCTFAAPASGITADNSIFIRQTGAGTARTFYVDNLSVTIAADYNYATDGSVIDGDNFATNWLTAGLGTATVTRSTTDGQDASDSAQVAITTGAANAGVRNKLSLNPLTNTLYRITAYAKVTSGSFTDFKIRYSRDGSTTAGGNYVDCVDYNTRTLSTTAWTRVTCYLQTDGTTATNPHVYFVQEASTTRTFRVDAFTMTLTTNTAPNVQIGGGENGGPTTLLTLDKAASAPIAINNDALLGSMYYDTTLGKLQCYEADGWGACGSSPDTIVTISPEFTNAVLHGTGVGTMVSDLCSDTLNINDGSSGQPNICGVNETYNFYKWTSPQPSAQTYSMYVTYQLPSSFKSFESGSTSIMGRTDSTNSTVEYQVYKNDAATGLTACGPLVSVATGALGAWQQGAATGTADPSTCGFSPGNSIVFRINVTASQNANAYIGNLNFIFSNR